MLEHIEVGDVTPGVHARGTDAQTGDVVCHIDGSFQVAMPGCSAATIVPAGLLNPEPGQVITTAPRSPSTGSARLIRAPLA